MKRILTMAMLLSFVLLAGCAGTSLRVSAPYTPDANQKFTYEIVNKGQMSDEALTIFRDRLESQLIASKLLTTGTDESARRVQIVIDNYYMRHGSARALVGIMAGEDNILSTIFVKEPKTGTVLSAFEVESVNPTAWGSSHGLIQEQADKIVSYLKSGKL